MRTFIATVVAASLALVIFPSSGFAQATPNTTSICNLPQYRGTPSYNRFCTGGGRVFVPPAPPPPPDPLRTFVIDSVSYTGEFYVVTSDGRVLEGRNAAQVTIDNGAHVITGPSGHVQITFPDGSLFTLNGDSEAVLDTFAYDPNPNVREVTFNYVKGFFRWITGHVTPIYSLKVTTPVGTIGIRGTDFEVNVEPGGSGYIKLNSGELVLTDFDTTKETIITAGQTVRFEDFKVVGR